MKYLLPVQKLDEHSFLHKISTQNICMQEKHRARMRVRARAGVLERTKIRDKVRTSNALSLLDSPPRGMLPSQESCFLECRLGIKVIYIVR